MENSQVVPFCFDGNEVRVTNLEGNPWFVAKDVCAVLGISQHRDALSRLDDDERGSVLLDTLGGKQDLSVISESGLYSLIFRSRKMAAKRFRKWVTSEVLPSIRKTGSYDIKSKKEVSVNHTHQRATTAPNGLDIKYNLDLTKVITKPTRQGLEILEKLTGISFAEITLGSDDVDELFQKFIAERCEVADGERVSSFALYGEWRRWLAGGGVGAPIGIKEFSRVVENHFTKIKSNRMMIVGLRLKEE